MTRAVAQQPSDLVLSSTTESQEAIEHAVSENWKEPFVPAKQKEEEAKAAKEAAEKVLADAKAAEEAKPKPEEAETEHADQESLDAEEKELLDRKAKGDKSVGKLPWSTRVNRLTARLASEREAREKLETRLAALERGDKTPVRGSDEAPTVADLPNKPKRIDFTDESQYVEKLIQWTRANEEYKDGIQAENERAKEVFVAHGERIEEARDRYDDWDTVAKNAMEMILPPTVDFAIREMSNSADVLYHIAKNPEVYAKMSKLSPYQMVAEAVRISDRLANGTGRAAANTNGNGKKNRPLVTEPITPGGRRSTAQGKKLEDMSPDEYVTARRQMRQARRAN